MRATHQWVTFATSTPMQQASAVALNEADARGYYTQLVTEYNQRRHHLLGILAQTQLPIIDAEGSYFVSVDVTPLGVSDVYTFCKRVAVEVGVVSIPMSAFYVTPNAPALVRFCFAKKYSTMDAAAERLQKLTSIDWR
jgi:aspartate/methionine/tyrosine aminotransferase